MSPIGKALLASALTLPLVAFVAGVLASPDPVDPDRSRPVIIGRVSDDAPPDKPTPTPRPRDDGGAREGGGGDDRDDRNGGDDRDDDDNGTSPGTVVMPQPRDVDGDDDDRDDDDDDDTDEGGESGDD